jgi:hypothetical protein
MGFLCLAGYWDIAFTDIQMEKPLHEKIFWFLSQKIGNREDPVTKNCRVCLWVITFESTSQTRFPRRGFSLSRKIIHPCKSFSGMRKPILEIPTSVFWENVQQMRPDYLSKSIPPKFLSTQPFYFLSVCQVLDCRLFSSEQFRVKFSKVLKKGFLRHNFEWLFHLFHSSKTVSRSWRTFPSSKNDSDSISWFWPLWNSYERFPNWSWPSLVDFTTFHFFNLWVKQTPTMKNTICHIDLSMLREVGLGHSLSYPK